MNLQDKIYLFRLERMMALTQRAEEDFLSHRYRECIIDVHEAVEYGWKALAQLAGIDFRSNGYPHFPKEQTWDEVAKGLKGVALDAAWDEVKDHLKQICKWRKGKPELLRRALYYEEPASRRRDFRTHANKLLSRTEGCYVREVLGIHRTLRHTQGCQLEVRVLDGSLYRSKNEQRCGEAPYGLPLPGGKDRWRQALRKSGAKPHVCYTSVGALNPSFAVVVNPFGECYPENFSHPGYLPGFEQLKRYVFGGGVLVTAGGHSFYYAWDVTKGGRHDTSVLSHRPDLGMIAVHQTLFTQTFGVDTTWDSEKADGPKGPIEVAQICSSKPNLLGSTDLPSQLCEMRSVLKASTRYTAVVEAKRSTETVALLAIVPYGYGAVVHLGLDLNDKETGQFALSVIANGLLPKLGEWLSESRGPVLVTSPS